MTDQVMLRVSTLTTTLFKFLKTQQHKIVNMASPFLTIFLKRKTP